VGDEVFVHGKLLSLKPRTMDHPETEIVEADGEASTHLHRIVPVYPLTEGLSQRWLRGLLWRALEEYGGQIPERHGEWLARGRGGAGLGLRAGAKIAAAAPPAPDLDPNPALFLPSTNCRKQNPVVAWCPVPKLNPGSRMITA
jgi:hypothetical protein